MDDLKTQMKKIREWKKRQAKIKCACDYRTAELCGKDRVIGMDCPCACHKEPING